MPPKSRSKAKKAAGWDSVRVGANDDAAAQEPETPKAERSPQAPHWPSRTLAAAALGFIAYGAKISMRIPIKSLDTWAGAPLRKDYTGMPAVDGIFMRLVSAFSFPLSGRDLESRMQLMYFVPMLGATALIWTIEGWRREHRPSTFMAAYQVFGIGLVAPLYFALSILSDKGDILGASVPADISKAAFPGVLFGFFLPTYFMFLEGLDATLHQKITALWQPSPVFAAVLTTFIAAFIRRASLGEQSAKFNQAKLAEKKIGNPLPGLRLAYALTTAILAGVHIYITWKIMFFSDMSIYDVFFNVPHPLADWDLAEPYSAMAIFMKFDLIFYTLAIVVFLLYCTVDLKMLGIIDSKQVRHAALCVLQGPLVVGPGATYVGFWWWREELLAEKA